MRSLLGFQEACSDKEVPPQRPPREFRGQGAAWIRATRHLALGFQLTLSQSSVTRVTDKPGATDPMCWYVSPRLNLILNENQLTKQAPNQTHF